MSQEPTECPFCGASALDRETIPERDESRLSETRSGEKFVFVGRPEVVCQRLTKEESCRVMSRSGMVFKYVDDEGNPHVDTATGYAKVRRIGLNPSSREFACGTITWEGQKKQARTTCCRFNEMTQRLSRLETTNLTVPEGSQ